MVMTVPSGPRSLGDVYVPMSISTGISIIIAKSVGRGGVSGNNIQVIFTPLDSI